MSGQLSTAREVATSGSESCPLSELSSPYRFPILMRRYLTVGASKAVAATEDHQPCAENVEAPRMPPNQDA